jgi:cytochrome oxidase assembly protein ShyY1
MLCHQEEAVKEDTVRVAGVIRAGEQPNMFVPNNQPEIGQWFYVDAPAMAQTMGLPQEMTYMEAVASPAAGDGQKQFPLPKESDAFLKSPVMPQDHLNYALGCTPATALSYKAVRKASEIVLYAIMTFHFLFLTASNI